MKFKTGIIALLSIFLLLFSCKKDKPAPPVVTTAVVNDISYTTAASGGEVTDDGGAPVLSRGVCWNTKSNPTIYNSKTDEKGGIGNFSSNITQLEPNTMYYLRAYATNSTGTGYGNEFGFSTSQVSVPFLTTAGISSITQTTATSGGNITADNGGFVTMRGVCWSISENPTIRDNKTSDGTGTGVFTSNLTGLMGNTRYYVSAYAENNAGLKYAIPVIFTTGPVVPTITTTAVSSITFTTCNTGGNINNDGGSQVTVRGTCWSTSPEPTISDSKTTDGTGTGNFVSNLTGLTSNTTYYCRAYAINDIGTGYGPQQIFKTDPLSISDIDGNVYNVIRIGTQLWTKENLKVTRYNNGDIIPDVTDSLTWNHLSTAAYCDYDNTPSNSTIYGRLYNWYTVDDTRNVCPVGWHVPNGAELSVMLTLLGWDLNTGGNLKETGSSHWALPNSGATNESGFTALPGGVRATYGFILMTMQGWWWTARDSWFTADTNPSILILFSERSDFNAATQTKKTGLSVRCMRD
jgi:uncharacterized protein (TIGR02145 family)